jgi:hypothetical protein
VEDPLCASIVSCISVRPENDTDIIKIYLGVGRELVGKYAFSRVEF